MTGTELPELGANVAVYYPARRNGEGREKGIVTSVTSDEFKVTFEGTSREFGEPISAFYGTWMLADTLEALRSLANVETV